MTGWQDWLEERALDREARGLARRLVEHDARTPLLDLAGNDYLGLACDPRVVEGAVEAARRYGAGARASRLVTGTLALHTALEERLAAFTGSATGLVLSTGYHANLAVVAALADRDGLVSVLGPVHGVGFLVLLFLCARGAGEGRWGWWFPALVAVTLGPPGSLVGDLRLRRRLRPGP